MRVKYENNYRKVNERKTYRIIKCLQQLICTHDKNKKDV